MQSALKLNAAALETRGVYCWLPDPKFGNFSRALSNRFRNPKTRLRPLERRSFDSLDQAVEWSMASWDDLARQVSARKPRLTVLSSETLFGVADTDSVLDALRAIFDRVTVLVYVRDPAEFYKSTLDQSIRGGMRLANLPLPGEFAPPTRRMLQAYHERLDRQDLIVRNFDRSNLAGGDVVTDFFEQIERVAGHPVDAPLLPPRENESLPAAATVWLLSLNEAFVRFKDADDREEVKARFNLINRLRKSPVLAGLPKLKLDDPQLLALVRQNSRATIEFVNATFFADQIPLAPVPASAEVVDPAAQRLRLFEWFMSQAPETLLKQVVGEAMKPLPAASA